MTPWTPEQIAALRASQADPELHPYTCGNDSNHILEPTPEGWVCPECDYRQNWAHGMDLEPKGGA